MTITDFDVWQDLVPTVTLNGSPEFDIWDQLVPLCDVGAILGGPPLPREARRLAIILD